MSVCHSELQVGGPRLGTLQREASQAGAVRLCRRGQLWYSVRLRRSRRGGLRAWTAQATTAASSLASHEGMFALVLPHRLAALVPAHVCIGTQAQGCSSGYPEVGDNQGASPGTSHQAALQCTAAPWTSPTWFVGDASRHSGLTCV